MLAIYGGLDQKVPLLESVHILAETFAKSGNQHVTIRFFPQADHTILQAITGFSSEPRPYYAYAPGYFRTTTD